MFKLNGKITSVRCWTTVAFLLGVMPIWLSSVEMWDGVIGKYALEINNWQIIKDWLLDSNWYVTYLTFLVADLVQQLAGIPHWIFFKICICISIAGIALEVKLLAKSAFNVRADIAAWLPAFIFSFPIWYIFFSYTPMIGHLICVWLALLGYRLLQSDKYPAFAFGILLTASSFQLASNCTFLLALELSRWLICSNKPSWKFSRSFLLLGLAMAVFISTRIVWPPVGLYVGYNKLLHPFEIGSWLTYFKYSFYWGTWFLLLAPLVLMAAGLKKNTGNEKFVPTLLLKPKQVLICFAMLIFAACAPYIAVGLGSPLFVLNITPPNSLSAALFSASGPVTVWYGGWGARHVLLLMVVMALFAGWFCQHLTSTSSKKSTAFTVDQRHVFTIMVVLNLIFLIPGHLSKLSRIANEQTIVELLKHTPEVPYGEVEFLLSKEINYYAGPYEANYLLYRAYGSTHWFSYMFPDTSFIRDWVEKNRGLAFSQPQSMSNSHANQNIMTDYDWSNRCKTMVRLVLPALGLQDILWHAEHAPAQLAAASLLPISSNCNKADLFWTKPSPKQP